MSLPGILFIFLQFALGVLCVRFLDPEKRLAYAERFFGAFALGFTASAFLLLTFLLVYRTWSAALVGSWFALIGSAGIVLRRLRYALPSMFSLGRLRTLCAPASLALCGALAVIMILYAALLLGTFPLNEAGFMEAPRMAWGDGAYHLDILRRLKTAEPFVLEHPVLAGERLRYPFLIDLLSALYERLGFSPYAAWQLPMMLLGISFLALMFLWAKRVLSKNTLALALVVVVLLGSGLGFLWFFDDLRLAWAAGGFGEVKMTALNPPQEYTNSHNGAPHGIVWIVPALSFFIHQRPFVMGAGLALLLFIGVWANRGSPFLSRWGLLWGMLPLSHTHTFIALTLVLGVWLAAGFLDRRRTLIGLGYGASVALPQLLFLAPPQTFFQAQNGWLISGNVFWFWTKNFGVLFWLWTGTAAAALLFRRRLKDIFGSAKVALALGGLALFLAANFIRFQPWDFDNNKILFYWWLLAAALALAGLGAWRGLKRFSHFLIALVVVLSILSGSLDVWRRFRGEATEPAFGYYGSGEVKTARWITANTEPNARFLTASNPDQFIPMLTGRPIYAGYEGWLWSQGHGALSRLRRERMTRFFASGDPQELCRDDIQYLLWDEELKKEYPNADHERILLSAEELYRDADGAREVLKIQCPTQR